MPWYLKDAGSGLYITIDPTGAQAFRLSLSREGAQEFSSETDAADRASQLCERFGMSVQGAEYISAPPKLIFIAGPYRAETIYGTLQNIRRAEAVALSVWKLGAVAFCPHMNTRLFDGELPDEAWLEGAKVILKRCDAIYMMPGWGSSVGATAEMEFAAANSVVVLLTWEELLTWLRENG